MDRMNSRKRLEITLVGSIPDCVPVAPDISNMIPAKLTGKPFWQLYLYKDPPIYMAYIDAAKYFDIDSLMDGYAPVRMHDEYEDNMEEMIVFQNDERIVTQRYDLSRSKTHNRAWEDTVTVYYRDNPPTHRLDPESIGLSRTPVNPIRIHDVKKEYRSAELLAAVKRKMGIQGLVGVFCGTSALLGNPSQIYEYYDNPNKYRELRDRKIELFTKRFNWLMELQEPPDFICTGASGTLVFQTPEIFRDLGLPIVKHIAKLCKDHGIPSHVHSCGPEKELVRICAEETDLTVIDPLEISPMGDCNLRDLKREFGHELVLKGNLHTTDIMLHGTTKQVVDACKAAIDDAAEGGRFILSTGDQCGRDTPFENIHAMVETARTYGRY
ncbi:MAG TPA: uroporphyrinogen decarboxylase family protein [Clostridia bacterium]|nr:uroporphyrinogen decarboxylase family protein [Clostridia bacterium]HPQ45916.1 uroporphyrinogen decarboxylase family protein [Clostridia bacterium]HRX41233.1 uroporphyrinogen decarboxylase family protein [Clostridia bacterium]